MKSSIKYLGCIDLPATDMSTIYQASESIAMTVVTVFILTIKFHPN